MTLRPSVQLANAILLSCQRVAGESASVDPSQAGGGSSVDREQTEARIAAIDPLEGSENRLIRGDGPRGARRDQPRRMPLTRLRRAALQSHAVGLPQWARGLSMTRGLRASARNATEEVKTHGGGDGRRWVPVRPAASERTDGCRSQLRVDQ